MPRLFIDTEDANINTCTLLAELRALSVKCTSVRRNDRGFVIYCDTFDDADKLFAPDALTQLKRVNCVPKLPRELKAKRSIILKSCDGSVMEKTSEEIKRELEKENSLNIVEVYKLQKSNSIKITLESQAKVLTVCQSGLYLYQLYVSPKFIVQDDYKNVLICYRCYKVDDHAAASCPENKNFVICSTCSSRTHNFKQCTSFIKLCINCKGPHHTTSRSCPVIKQVIVKKNNSNYKTYSDAAKQNNPHVTLPDAGNLDVGNVLSKSFLCILIATLKEAENKGSFETVLKSLLLLNKLPPIDIGEVTPPSLSVLLSNTESLEILNHERRNYKQNIMDQQQSNSYSHLNNNDNNTQNERQDADDKTLDGERSSAHHSGVIGNKTDKKRRTSIIASIDYSPVCNSSYMSLVESDKDDKGSGNDTVQQLPREQINTSSPNPCPKTSERNSNKTKNYVDKATKVKKKITIYKRATPKVITSENIETLYRNKVIYINSPLDMPDTLDLLKADIGNAEIKQTTGRLMNDLMKDRAI